MLAGLGFFMGGCNKPPNNGTPFYLYIDSPSVKSVFPFGSSSSKIPAVWATSGSSNLGAYEMPVSIPILSGGNIPIAVSAGIHDNGQVSIPIEYPFYAPDTFAIPNAIPGHVYHHHPVYTYYSYTQMALNADFEASDPFTNIVRLTSLADSTVFEGTASGGIIIPSSVAHDTAVQTIPIQIDASISQKAYIELNFKINNPSIFCNVNIIASLYSGGNITNQVTYPKFTMPPNGYWDKVYLNFDNEVGSNPNYYFQVQFIASHTPSGQQDTVYLDNIKLLYFH